MKRHGGARMRGAFTIIETLTALALLVLLMGAILVFMWTVRDRRSRVVGLAGSTRSVLAMLDQIESDLTTTIAAEAREGAGVSGDDATLRVVFRSVWLRGPLGVDVPRDLHGASYAFDAASARVEAERWSAGGEPLHVGLAEGVGRVRFRYYDGRSWVETFDSRARGGLPVAVEVSVWRGSSDEAVDWRRVIRVPDATALAAVGISGGEAGTETGAAP